MQGSLASCRPHILHPACFLLVSATAHARAAVVAEVAVAGADGDGAAVVAGWGVGLEVGELLAAGRRGAGIFEQHAGAGQQRGADVAGRAGAV